MDIALEMHLSWSRQDTKEHGIAAANTYTWIVCQNLNMFVISMIFIKEIDS